MQDEIKYIFPPEGIDRLPSIQVGGLWERLAVDR